MAKVVNKHYHLAIRVKQSYEIKYVKLGDKLGHFLVALGCSSATAHTM